MEDKIKQQQADRRKLQAKLSQRQYRKSNPDKTNKQIWCSLCQKTYGINQKTSHLGTKLHIGLEAIDRKNNETMLDYMLENGYDSDETDCSDFSNFTDVSQLSSLTAIDRKEYEVLDIACNSVQIVSSSDDENDFEDWSPPLPPKKNPPTEPMYIFQPPAPAPPPMSIFSMNYPCKTTPHYPTLD